MRLSWALCYLTVAAAIPTAHRSKVREFRKSAWKGLGAETIAIHSENQETRRPVCRTKHCTNVAEVILKSGDPSVDPCEDFYEHACGQWERNNPIPSTEVAWSEDHKITDKVFERIRDILVESNENDIEPVRMAKKLYRMCMDTEAIENRGIQPLLDIVRETGGWPMAMPVDEWDENKTSWQEIDTYYMTLTGDSAFYNLEYERDERNTSRNILSMDQMVQHPLSSKKERSGLLYDFGEPYMNGIETIVQIFADAHGYRLDKKQLILDILEIVNLELGLEKIIEDEKLTDRLGNEHTIMTIKELQDWYELEAAEPISKINFLEVIRIILSLGNIDIDESEPVLVYNKECLHKLAKLLAEKSPRVIVNYIQWNMVHNYLYYTTEEMTNIKFNIYFGKYNITNHSPRWKFCLSAIEMKDALSYIFVNRYFSDDVIAAATDMLNSIQEELELRIRESDWLQDEVKDFMKEKLENIVKQIGYPASYKNETYLIERYKGLTIGEDFFESTLKCQRYELIRTIIEFKQPIDRTEWLDFPMTVNAFYSEDTNTIIIPAAELQDPYFTEHLPDAVNYGAVGFVIGHELSHAFDNDGIEHDKEGNKVSWAFDEISDEYGRRAECFVEQFGHYELNAIDESGEPIKLPLDGNLTEDENIADSTGIQVAFAAYKKARMKRLQFKLPGLEDVPDDQLFFLSFATSWCGAIDPQYESDTANNDEHSPSRYRVVGSLSNLKSFSKAFNCPPKSPMNPENKCSLWK